VFSFQPADIVAQLNLLRPIYSKTTNYGHFGKNDKDLTWEATNKVQALLKAKPGAFNYASSGNGTIIHLAGEMFKAAAGVDILHVPYRGGGPAMADLLGGRVQALITTAAGLVTAIPAVIAFNLITHSIRDFAARTDDFALEVLNVVERQQPVSARVPEGVEVRR